MLLTWWNDRLLDALRSAAVSRLVQGGVALTSEIRTALLREMRAALFRVSRRSLITCKTDVPAMTLRSSGSGGSGDGRNVPLAGSTSGRGRNGVVRSQMGFLGRSDGAAGRRGDGWTGWTGRRTGEGLSTSGPVLLVLITSRENKHTSATAKKKRSLTGNGVPSPTHLGLQHCNHCLLGRRDLFHLCRLAPPNVQLCQLPLFLGLCLGVPGFGLAEFLGVLLLLGQRFLMDPTVALDVLREWRVERLARSLVVSSRATGWLCETAQLTFEAAATAFSACSSSFIAFLIVASSCFSSESAGTVS
jgi:hypothetical protein